MFLSNDQARRFQDHLRQADVRGDCPVCCQPLDWVASAELVAVPTYLYLNQGTSPQKLVRCVCPHCAAITMFDATAIGLDPHS